MLSWIDFNEAEKKAKRQIRLPRTFANQNDKRGYFFP